MGSIKIPSATAKRHGSWIFNGHVIPDFARDS